MFAEDWLSLLRCQMPGYDVIPHLVDLLGLHVLLYKLKRAKAWVEPGSPVRLVLEIIAPRRTTIRDLAGETYLINNMLSRQALDNYIRETVEHSAEWQQALQDPDPFGAALKTLESKVAWPTRTSMKARTPPKACFIPSRGSSSPPSVGTPAMSPTSTAATLRQSGSLHGGGREGRGMRRTIVS